MPASLMVVTGYMNLVLRVMMLYWAVFVSHFSITDNLSLNTHSFIHFKKCTPQMYIQGTPLCQEQFEIFPTCHIQSIFILFTNYIR